MLNLKERPRMIDNAPAAEIAPAQLTPALPIRAGQNAGGSTDGSVLGAGKRALLKIAAGIAKFGSVLTGPPMSERGRFRYAATASKIQMHRGIAANWRQFPSR